MIDDIMDDCQEKKNGNMVESGRKRVGTYLHI